MTEKDYAVISTAVTNGGWQVNAATRVRGMTKSTQANIKAHDSAVAHVVYNLADSLKRGDPQFDRAGFIKACGVTA